jgi:ribonuclease HII
MRIADLTPEQLQMWGRGEGIAEFDISSAEKERLAALSVYEEEIWGGGVEYIAGIDEVGRGPIAGPVVAAAVILPKHCLLPGINDSKKLSAKKRYVLEPVIRRAAVAWALGAVGAREIDRYNILEATKIAMLRAVAALPVRPEHLLLDAVRLDSSIPQTSLIKGDAKSISIGAASILAKCHRDRMMEIYDEMYPGYGLAKHAGYPTKAHKEAVFALGYSPIHRRSFVLKPIKK